MAHEAFDKVWADAKEEFESLTQKKKPKESKGIFNAFGAHTGLSSSLKSCEAGYVACNTTVDIKVKEGQKAAKEFAASFKKFETAKASYMKVLAKAIADEFSLRPDKDTKSVYEKALKYLTKELDALEKTIDSSVQNFTQKFDQAVKDLSIKEKMLLNWEKNIKAALARAIAGASKVKANPTPDAYNGLFPTIARDVTMQLVFARDIDGLKADPNIFFQALQPWASQSNTGLPCKVPVDYTPDQVRNEITPFIAEIKRVVQLVGSRG